MPVSFHGHRSSLTRAARNDAVANIAAGLLTTPKLSARLDLIVELAFAG